MLVVAVSTTGAEAGGADTPQTSDVTMSFVESLSTGWWLGTGNAGGLATASASGFAVTVDADLRADFRFGVSADLGGGEVRGVWNFAGPGVQTVSGSAAGVSIEAVGPLRYSGGGDVSGDTRNLILTGQVRTRGTVEASTSMGAMSFPVDNSNPLPTLAVQVLAGSCGEVLGDWTFSVEDRFEDAGFRADFAGFWWAWRDPDRSIDEALDELEDAVAASFRGDDPGPLASGSPLFDLAAGLVIEFNDFTELGPPWPPGDLFDLLARTESALADLRALDACERVFFGDDRVERYLHVLTRVIQELVIASARTVAVEDWQLLVNIAARTGAIGPGSIVPERAVDAEQRLYEVAVQILEPNLDALDELLTDEVVRVLATSAAMEWSFEIAGEVFTAAEIWAAAQDALAASTAGEVDS